MSCINFNLFSTAGNTTLFVDKPGAARPSIGIIPCEQAAYADVEAGIVRMAADEFCVNACLAFAALRKLAGLEPGQMRMADISVLLQADGSRPNWQASALLPVGHCVVEEINGIKVAQLPGISHALLATGSLPQAATARPFGTNLLTELNLHGEPAAGIVWYCRKNSHEYAILPLVSVPGVNTCNFEHACGSATVALALVLGYGEYQVEQPSGVDINVRNLGGKDRNCGASAVAGAR